jgi:colanic acid biosynthesis glycosyl transferase WcaI
MKILLITGYFPPDTGSAANLFYELGGRLVAKGHTVTVLTAFPSYHVTGQAKRYTGKFVEEQVEGMRVCRVQVPQLPRYVPTMRGVWQFLMALGFWRALGRVGPHDVALVYSPPLPLGFVGAAAKKRWGTRFILNVQDLFPQSAIDLGILKSRFLIRIFQRLERRIYRSADHVTVHSPGNKAHIVKVGIDPSKVSVIPNWIDTDYVRPGERYSQFTASHGLNGEFVVSFAGVLGYSQDIDVILEAARQLKERKDILFLIVGDGVEKERLEGKAKAMSLTNIRFLPMQPRAVYPSILHASDVCLSTLNKEVVSPVVPSKILSIMAAGKPVVACMNLQGDAPEIVKDAQCGFVLDAGDHAGLAAALVRLRDSKPLRHELGANGRTYCETHFSLDGCCEKYVELFGTLL